MGIVQRSQRTSQPPSAPCINRSNPITLGLIGFLWHGPGKSRELVASWWDVLQPGMTRGPKLPGVAAVSDAASTSFIGSGPLGATVWSPTALPISYFAFFDHTRPPASTQVIAGYCSGSSDGYNLLDMFGTGDARAAVNISTTLYTVNGGGGYKWVSGASIRGLTCNSATLTGYDNGKSFGTTSTASGSITYDGTYSRKALLGFGAGLGGIGGYAFWEALWNRVLTPTEVAALSQNPWQLYEPTSRMIWTPASGGAPPASGGLAWIRA
jgi:hypothetical protein